MKLQGPEFGASKSMIEVHGLSDHLPAAQDTHQCYMVSSGHSLNPHQANPHQVCYQNMTSHQSCYLNMDVQRSTCQNMDAHHSPYESMNQQQSPYAGTAQPSVYSHIRASQGYTSTSVHCKILTNTIH